MFSAPKVEADRFAEARVLQFRRVSDGNFDFRYVTGRQGREG